MKEQGKKPPDQTSEEEIGILLEKEFRVMRKAIKGEIDSNRIILGDVNTPLSPMDRSSKMKIGAFLVAQRLRICLLMQGTRVRALVWEDPTCHGATGPVSHNY